MKKIDVQKLTLSALFIAIGLVLPFVTMQIQTIGQLLSPMHLPVILCGLVCGPIYGAIVGLIVPLLRSFIFGMPKLFPGAIAMAFELATYGFVTGYLYEKSKWKCVLAVYKAMIPAMIAGRIVGGIVQALLLGGQYSFSVFVTSYFVKTVPGIVLQLVLIPIIMLALGKAHMIPFHENAKAQIIK
ncbi:ECF transporter S component [Oribacterium sp. WCC10]|uniref:ECF transporter S component n=1 Tax=Oribacterium sp. WCC10 TaxID=1855343 RepID=UPI0008E3CC67|nr:ECF transporter S component [Oribacterium sp. WCC10]SFG18443.1 ECF transporter S component, folate family [Oribacterium sp. WCC10]